MNTAPLPSRLFSKVVMDGPCWKFTGTLGHGGRYGSIYVDGRMRPAHRVMYELLVGPIPDGLELDHLCRNTRCVLPDHLEPVSHQENVRRGLSGLSQTHCRLGHPKNPPDARGERVCRTCRRAADRARRMRIV